MFETVGLWLTIPDSIHEEIRQRGGHFMGALHAAEHALIALFPLLAICDRGDIGGISYTLHPQIGRPAIFIYDGHPGGVGLAAKGFGELETLIGKTADLLRACPCDDGCPRACSRRSAATATSLDKESAALVLEMLIGRVPLAAEPRPAPGRGAWRSAPQVDRRRAVRDGR
jgi:DEAD/DEAH box helicase domain-containing protein